MVILEEDHATFVAILERLREEANAQFAFLVDKNGQQVARTGDMDDVDPTALASLTAGNVAATEGLAQLIGESSFSTLFHEGEQENLHLSVIANRFILLVVFDEHSSLGLVRLRVKQRGAELAAAVDVVLNRTGDAGTSPVESLAEITDADIDALFG